MIFLFMKHFFQETLKKGYAPRMGAAYTGMGKSVHVGFHPLQSKVSGKAANIWTEGNTFIGNSKDMTVVKQKLADIYYKAYDDNKNFSLYQNNISLIPRGNRT